MALIGCPECELAISRQAFHCPRCGFPLRKPMPRYLLRLTILLGFFVGVIALYFLALLLLQLLPLLR